MTQVKVLQIKVKPQARVSQLVPAAQGPWLAQLKSPPVDGQANAELITLVAKHLGCRKSQVRIKSGTTSRLKWVSVEGVDDSLFALTQQVE
jgi:uncharacterized protein (TIGR00251 family)